MATMAEGSSSVSCYRMFLVGLFHSFAEETISGDDYIRNYDDVAALNKETDRDRLSYFPKI